MKKRAVVFLFLLLLVSFLLLAQAQANPPKEAKVASEKLTDSIYKLVLNDIVNIVALIGPDGVLLIDSGFDAQPVFGYEHSPAAVKAELTKLGGGSVRYIIDTHTDIDHAYGNAELGAGAVIIAHQLGRERLSGNPRFPPQGLPNVTFSDALHLYFNGESIDLYSLPGHTHHDIVVHFKKGNIVCVGDLIIPDSFGSISPTGNVHSLVKAMDFLLSDRFPEDATYVAGHDRPLKRGDVQAYKNMIEKTLEIMVDEVKKGQGPDEMVKEKVLKDWEKWNGGLFKELNTDTWIRMVYPNIADKPSAAGKIGELLNASSFSAVQSDIRRLTAQRKEFYFMEAEFNNLGYRLINQGKTADAVEIFKITAEMYPGSWNAFDSLAEGYMTLGNKKLAVKYYEQSVRMNPKNTNGLDQLKKLKGK